MKAEMKAALSCDHIAVLGDPIAPPLACVHSWYTYNNIPLDKE